ELLQRLDGVPRPWTARFVCVIVLAVPGRDACFFEGECRGEVVPEWRGEAGFRSDPIFLVPGTGKTFGEMPPGEKRKCSDRSAAARALLKSGARQPATGSFAARAAQARSGRGLGCAQVTPPS